MPSRTAGAAFRALSMPAGFLPPACAIVGRPPPPPPTSLAIGRHGHQVDLAALLGDEKDHAAAEFLLELVAQVAESVHVDILDGGSQELHALDLHYLVHDVAECVLRFLGLEGLVLALHSLELVLKLPDVVSQRIGSSLDHSRRLMHLLLEVFIVSADVVAGQRLNSANACRDAVLGQDLELADLACVLYMCAAAELSGEFTHLDYAYFVAVFLAEQSHSAALLSVFDTHDRGLDIETFRDLLVDKVFHGLDLIRCHSLEVAEVESGAVRVLIGALLLDVSAEDYAERLLHKVRRAVVSADIAAVLRID